MVYTLDAEGRRTEVDLTQLNDDVQENMEDPSFQLSNSSAKSGFPWWAWLLIVLGVLLAAWGVIILIRRRRGGAATFGHKFY